MLEWSGAAVDRGGGKPVPEEWTDVTVPGRPDAFAGADAVAYRTVFDDPRDPDDAVALLELRGLYDGGRVWLDDDLVAEPDSVADPVSVVFEPADRTELVVVCEAPDDRFGGIHDTDRVPDADAVPGVWWDVDLSTHPATFVADVSTSSRVTDDGAVVDASVDVYADEGFDDRLTLTTRPAGERRGRGMMDRVAVEAAAGERTTVEKRIELRDPSLWWPRELGPQDRYEVRAKLDDAVATATTGLATVTETDDGLAVNGEPVPVRGVTLQDASVADVELAASVNANLVRAHAHVLSPAVYEACDEAGILVWQDLPLTGPGAVPVERGRDLAAGIVETYASHPSLAVVGVHDEPTRTFADRLGAGFLDRLRFRWRVWRSDYDGGDAREVARAVPDDLPVYPVVGEPGTDPDAAVLYPGWDYGHVDDMEWVREKYGLDGAVGEFGAGSLGEADPSEFAGFDRAKHDAAVAAAGGSDDATGGDGTGDAVDASQAYQATVVRTVAERLRADGVAVTVANALRDTGDAGMGVFDSTGSPKAAAEALTRAFEPVQAILTDPGPGESDVVVVNGLPKNTSGTLTWAAGDESGEVDVTVGATGRAVATTIEVPADAARATLELETAERSVHNEYHL